jgi:hypothetical protein
MRCSMSCVCACAWAAGPDSRVGACPARATDRIRRDPLQTQCPDSAAGGGAPSPQRTPRRAAPRTPPPHLQAKVHCVHELVLAAQLRVHSSLARRQVPGLPLTARDLADELLLSLAAAARATNERTRVC